MNYSADLRTRLTSAVDNGRIDNWRVALDGFDASRCTAPAPARTGSPGTTTGRRRRSRSTTATRCTWRRCPSWASSGWCCCWSRSGRCSSAALVRLGGAERHAHGAFVAAGTMLALHAGDRLGLGDAGAVRVAVRRGRRRAGRARGPRSRRAGPHAARGRRAGRARAGDHAGAVRLLAGRRWTAPSTAFARPRLRDGDRRRADRHRALRRRARSRGWSLGYCDARAGPVRARPARDGRRPRARPGQLAVRLRPGDRLRRVRPRPAAVRRARRCG